MMKSVTILLSGLFLFFAVFSPARAQTPITEDIALKYYDSCLGNTQKEGTMTKQSREKYCLCTANQMKKAMSQEEVKAVAGNDQSARNAINKILTDVNAPCTQYPLHDKVYKQCMTSVNQHATCSCLSRNISEYIATISQNMMRDILDKNPNINDPLGEIMNTREYKSAEKQIALSCATNSQY